MSDQSPVRLRFDAFELDEANARLTRNGAPVGIPPKAFAVLCTLARSHGKLVTKDALLDAVWGHHHVSESVLKNIISSIRAALADDAKTPRYIETASRFGYRFIAPLPETAIADRPVPTQQAFTTVPATAMVGRELAMARLHECWSKARAGQKQLLFVVGEAGVGKTTLIESFVAQLPPKTAAFGRCVEHFGSGEPYLPVIEVVAEIARLEPEFAQLLRAMAPTWVIQMPWLVNEEERAALSRELAGAHPDRMMREMREVMQRFAANRPVLFILEDMHWSDLGTLRMMENFARRPGSVPILWIATFRLTQVIAENHPLHGLRQELRVQRLCEEIVLDPFSEEEVGAYLGTRLGHAQLPEGFVRRLHAHTDGLPLFVANVADSLAAQVGQDAAALEQMLVSAAPLPVPDSLAGVIDKQALRLEPEIQAILEAASVCGVEFRAGIVANMIGQTPQWVREQCDTLARRQIWLRPVGIVELPDGGFDSRYSFLHALYPHVLYQRLALSQRVEHHRRAARSLHQNRGAAETIPPAELASHHERGHEFLAAMRAYGEAAGLALAHFAPKDSAQLAARGRSLVGRCPDTQERMEAELVLATHSGIAATQLHGVASKEAREAFAATQVLCDRLPQTPSRAVTLNGLGWIYYVRGEFQEALGVADRLETISAQHPDAILQVLACNLRGVALVNTGKLVAACEWLERGIAACAELGDQGSRPDIVIDPEVSMRMNVAYPLINRGLTDQARAHLRAGTERAYRLGHPMSVMLSHWCGGMVAARLGQTNELAQHAAELSKVVESGMIAQAQGPSLWLRGLAEARLGDPRSGHQRILEGYECHARHGMYGGCSEVLGYAAEALMLAGDWTAARARVDAAFELAERINERLCLPDLLLLRARIEAHEHNPAASRASLRESQREAEAQGACGLELNALVALAEIPKPRRDDLVRLRSVYQGTAEGHDTKVYRRAEALLRRS